MLTIVFIVFFYFQVCSKPDRIEQNSGQTLVINMTKRINNDFKTTTER